MGHATSHWVCAVDGDGWRVFVQRTSPSADRVRRFRSGAEDDPGTHKQSGHHTYSGRPRPLTPFVASAAGPRTTRDRPARRVARLHTSPSDTRIAAASGPMARSSAGVRLQHQRHLLGPGHASLGHVQPDLGGTRPHMSYHDVGRSRVLGGRQRRSIFAAVVTYPAPARTRRQRVAATTTLPTVGGRDDHLTPYAVGRPHVPRSSPASDISAF